MAQVITVNQNKGSRGTGILVVRSDATGFLSTNGVDGVSQANTAGETISAMHLAEVTWSTNSASAAWTLKRGADTVFVCHGQNGHINFQQSQMRLETGNQAQANVVFELAGGTGNIVIKIHKQSGE